MASLRAVLPEGALGRALAWAFVPDVRRLGHGTLEGHEAHEDREFGR